MDYIIISITALLVSGMALYTGFGLGTLLMPVFALFFPVPTAIVSTAVVHLANNVFRIGFVGRHADWRVALLFGLPAVPAAIVGALILTRVSEISPLTTYHLGNREFQVTVVKLVVAVLIAGFAMVALMPYFSNWKLSRRFLPLGGILSGFFGGLSGHQGELRSATLLGAGLPSAAFVGTGSVASFMVDVTRLVVYGAGPLRETLSGSNGQESLGLVGAAIAAAFLGTYLSSRFLKSVTIGVIRKMVGVLLALLAIALASGLV